MFDYVYIDDWQVPGLRALNGLGSPTPRQDVTDRAARHGAIDRTLFYSGRVLELQGVLSGIEADVWATFDSLKAKLALGSSHVLRFRRTGRLEDEQLEVIVASTVDDGTSYDAPGVVKYGVSLHAADPRIYSAALRSSSYFPGVAISGGGVDLPLAFPLMFDTGGAGLLEVGNGGTFDTPPVLTITGPVVNPILDNVTTGKSIEFVCVLGSSDVIEVDVAARSVTLNGASRPDLLTPQATTWWELAPGTNEIRLRGTGIVTPSLPRLSLWWPLDESVGSLTADDESGAGNTGSYGSGVTPGQSGIGVGLAALFDNTSGAVVTASAYEPFVANSQRTFMGWANREGADTDTLLTGDAGGGNQPLLKINGGVQNVFWLAKASGSSVSWTGAWPGAGERVHWALTYDDSTGVAELFVNGVSQGQETIPAGSRYSGAAGHFRLSDTTNPWNGYMQDAAVFESILSAADIAAIAAGGSLTFQPPGTELAVSFRDARI